jgi:hypothetical protein
LRREESLVSYCDHPMIVPEALECEHEWCAWDSYPMNMGDAIGLVVKCRNCEEERDLGDTSSL